MYFDGSAHFIFSTKTNFLLDERLHSNIPEKYCQKTTCRNSSVSVVLFCWFADSSWLWVANDDSYGILNERQKAKEEINFSLLLFVYTYWKQKYIYLTYFYCCWVTFEVLFLFLSLFLFLFPTTYSFLYSPNTRHLEYFITIRSRSINWSSIKFFALSAFFL